MEAIYTFLNKSRIFRRGGYCLTWLLIIQAAWWTAAYADTALAIGISGTAVAMVIGAVLTPLGALAAAVFKFYNEGRVNDGSDKSLERKA